DGTICEELTRLCRSVRPRENPGRLRLPVRRFATPAALRTGLTSTGRQLRIKSVISAYLFFFC
ncbi:hypothetical protein, partial [Klebsiella sp. C253]|uniref:hypothetical protein n=1 Tax=Klebsiella sp. C253 TaxID=3409932 RepID=UPI003772BBD4